MIGSGTAIGIEASARLARLGSVQIEPGLTDTEFHDIERRFGFQFADDHRAFLAAGLPVWTPGVDDHPDKASCGWPNWRDSDSEDLRRQVDRPIECIRSAIHDGHWPDDWGKRPTSEHDTQAKTQRMLTTVPRMVPIYAHRYLPGGPATSGHPVLSIHTLDDIIVYGLDLVDYIDQELRTQTLTVSFWQKYL